VSFTGKILDSELDRLLAQANVVTSASDHEAFGLAVADGLAAGTQVVASSIPAHLELARLAGTDASITLVDPRDAGKFADSLAAALRAGRVSAPDLKLPSWAEVIADTRDVYSQVRSQGRPIDRRGS
jgi:glycosyltransferase involved in cell wall biosynthesis